MKMPIKTRDKMRAFAGVLNPSSAKAQCLNIAGMELADDETIASRIRRDHSSADGHLRAASLMVSAGCATEEGARRDCYGTFAFEDGSTF